MRVVFAVAALVIMSSPAAADPYKPHWQKVQGNDGSVFQIDTNSLNGAGGSVSATVYLDEGGQGSINNLRAVIFQCPDRMVMISTMGSLLPSVYLPPRSVGRQMADIACRGKTS